MKHSQKPAMTDSTEIATSPKSTRSKHSNSSVQIPIQPKSQSEFLPRDTEKSEFLDLLDFGDVAFSVQAVIHNNLQSHFIQSLYIVYRKCLYAVCVAVRVAVCVAVYVAVYVAVCVAVCVAVLDFSEVSLLPSV